jgi:hypothetical protein
MLNRIIELIKLNLTNDLLHSKYRHCENGGVAGHCYVATECLYHLYGKKNGYKPKCYKYSNEETHWWLEKNGHVLDPTKEQCPDFDYSLGRSQNFLFYPSKRCLVLVERITPRLSGA